MCFIPVIFQGSGNYSNSTNNNKGLVKSPEKYDRDLPYNKLSSNDKDSSYNDSSLYDTGKLLV